MKELSWAYQQLCDQYDYCGFWADKTEPQSICDNLNAIAKKLALPEHWIVKTVDLGEDDRMQEPMGTIRYYPLRQS